MNNLVLMQLMGLIDSSLDTQELTSRDIGFRINNVIQIIIQKIKLVCFKYALNDDLDNKLLDNEILEYIKDCSKDEQEYLIQYMNNLRNKMKDVLSPTKKIPDNDRDWHWGEDKSPNR